MRRFTHRSKRMLAGRWYRVDDDHALALSKVRQPHAPGSTSTRGTPLAFDVAKTKKEAEAIEKATAPKEPVEDASDLTTADLTTKKEPEAAPAEKAKVKPARRSRRGSG